jgi:DNA-binding response OmpR family regulator
MNPQSTLSPRPAPRFRILYVDDNPALRRLGERVLKAAGYDVHPCDNGAEAWALLHSHPYHLLITDNQMPELTGLELIRKVRLAGMTIPIILVSGVINALSSDDLQWLPCGTTMGKPFSPEQLISSVRELLAAAAKLRTGAAHDLFASAEWQYQIQPHSHWGINE